MCPTRVFTTRKKTCACLLGVALRLADHTLHVATADTPADTP